MPRPHSRGLCWAHWEEKRCHSGTGTGKASIEGQEEEQILLLIGCSSLGVVLAESFAGVSLIVPWPLLAPLRCGAIVFIGRMDNVTSGQLTTFTKKDSTARRAWVTLELSLGMLGRGHLYN